jgi:hypothetical protein
MAVLKKFKKREGYGMRIRTNDVCMGFLESVLFMFSALFHIVTDRATKKVLWSREHKIEF